MREAATGEVLVELADHLGVATNNVAEYTGLLEGLRAAIEIDPDAVIEARLDSKLVVEQMSGRWAIKNDTLATHRAAGARRRPARARQLHVGAARESNKAADKLANESMDAVERGRSGIIRRSPADAFETEAERLRCRPVLVPRSSGWGPDIGAPTVTLIVRHGVTQHSLERRFSGSGGPFDPPLVAQGIAQAEAAAGEVAQRGGGDVLVCSPMLRTRETAAIIGARIGLTPIVVEGLEEGRFGDWDGLTFAEVLAGWPDEMAAWLSSPDVAPPGGESLTQVCERVWGALDRVLADHPGRRIIIGGHVGTIRALTVRALGAPLQAMNRMELAPASITTLTWYADGNASMRSFAESSHLDGIASTWTP